MVLLEAIRFALSRKLCHIRVRRRRLSTRKGKETNKMAEYSVILKHWRTRLSFHNGIMSFLQPAMTSVASFAHTVVFIGLRDSEPSEGSKYARGLQEAWPVSGSNIEFRGRPRLELRVCYDDHNTNSTKNLSLRTKVIYRYSSTSIESDAPSSAKYISKTLSSPLELDTSTFDSGSESPPLECISSTSWQLSSMHTSEDSDPDNE